MWEDLTVKRVPAVLPAAHENDASARTVQGPLLLVSVNPSPERIILATNIGEEA
jgi:hypothetical protein